MSKTPSPRPTGKMTPFEIAEDWYREKDIESAVACIRWQDEFPRDTTTPEFAKWLTRQYRIAMAKGIQIGRGGV